MNDSDANPPPAETDLAILAAMRGLKLDAEAMAVTGAMLASLKSDAPEQERDAIGRWGNFDQLTGRARRPLYFHLAVAVITLAMVAIGAWEVRSYLRDRDGEHAIKPSHNTWNNRLLLGLGKPGWSAEETAKALCDTEPANPAYFSLYMSDFHDRYDVMPVDYWKTVSLLDPSNPEFLYLEACSNGTPATFPDALKILHEARTLAPRRTYRLDLIRTKIPLLRQGMLKELLASRSVLSRQPEPGANFNRLFHIIGDQARRFRWPKNVQGFLSLKEDTDSLLQNLASGETPGIDTTTRWIGDIRTCLIELRDTAIELRLPLEVAELDARIDRLKSISAARSFTIDGVDVSEKIGSQNQNLIELLSQLVHPPPLTDRDVMPMRMIDHENSTQMATVLLCVATTIGALLAILYRFRCPRLIRLLSVRLVKVLQPVDWWWLALTGPPPWIYTMIIVRATPWGGTTFNVSSNEIQLPFRESIPLTLAQFIGTFLMMVILPILVARWRMAKRLAFFGFASSPGYVSGVIAILCAAAFIPLVGWAFLRKSDPWLMVSALVLAVPLAWIIGIVLRSITTNSRLIRMAAVSQVVIPAYVAGLTVLLLTVPYFNAARHHWFVRDTLLHMDPAFPGRSKYEYLLDVQAQKELREALGY